MLPTERRDGSELKLRVFKRARELSTRDGYPERLADEYLEAAWDDLIQELLRKSGRADRAGTTDVGDLAGRDSFPASDARPRKLRTGPGTEAPDPAPSSTNLDAAGDSAKQRFIPPPMSGDISINKGGHR